MKILFLILTVSLSFSPLQAQDANVDILESLLKAEQKQLEAERKVLLEYRTQFENLKKKQANIEGIGTVSAVTISLSGFLVFGSIFGLISVEKRNPGEPMEEVIKRAKKGKKFAKRGLLFGSLTMLLGIKVYNITEDKLEITVNDLKKIQKKINDTLKRINSSLDEKNRIIQKLKSNG